MIVTMITEDSLITIDGDQLTVPVAAELGEWAVQFDGESAEIEYSDNRPNEVINAATFYARYQSDIDAHAAERLENGAYGSPSGAEVKKQLMSDLSAERKFQERQGVAINNIRYAGDPGNRQALQESIAFMEDAGLTKFPKWKDSDNQFHAGHLLSDVVDAYQAIGERRAALIAIEGEYAEKITEGTLTDLGEVVWS